jgi:glutamate--cysteine ligase catalytic subunit
LEILLTCVEELNYNNNNKKNMGFLEVGAPPMEWKDNKEYHAILDHVRQHGVTQFLLVWNAVKSRKNDQLLWGDEIEYHLYRREGERLVVTCRAAELLKLLEEEDSKLPTEDRNVTWHPEFGAWMIEATPSRPYGGFASDLRRVEPNMRSRRYRLLDQLKHCGENFGVVSMTAWPMLGTPKFWEPRLKGDLATNDNAASQSLFFPDSCVNPHPRFPTLTANIRKRRGRKVNIHLPLFPDVNTAQGPAGKTTYPVLSGDLKTMIPQPEVYMDAMGFGMGNCCLQVTFQARDLEESRYLYDQLAILCPIFLALTAGSPIFKGMLVDVDARWNVIAASVDCRTPTESGESTTPITLPGAEVPQRNFGPIRKSRYDSVDWFMSNHASFKHEYNDVGTEFHEPTLQRLMEAGVDERLARHVAHLYIRDPLVIFSDRIDVDDTKTTEHFENIQSTNWQTMRWKPPPLGAPMGWRVEFRPMEVQFSDFENAAFTVVIALCARVILFFDLSLYIPLSKVDENMKRSQQRDAVLKEKFFFRKNLIPLATQCDDDDDVEMNGTGAAVPTRTNNSYYTRNNNNSNSSNNHHDIPIVTSTTTSSSSSSVNINTTTNGRDISSEYEEMTIREIILGKGEEFAGIVPLIWAYLDVIGIDPESRSVVEDYLDLIIQRAKGTLPTPASWMRSFIDKHPQYKHDSIIPDAVARDLVETICSLASGEKHLPELLGRHQIPKLDEDIEIDRLEVKLRQIPPKPLRGSSFHKEVGHTTTAVYQCGVVRALIEKYRNRGEVSPQIREALITENRAFAEAKPLFKRLKTV